MQKDKNKHLMSHGPYQNVGTKLTLHGSVVPQWQSRRANEGIEEFTSLTIVGPIDFDYPQWPSVRGKQMH